MSAYKTDQRRVLYHGREYHFVSYEGVAANPRRGQVAAPPTWFLMRAGKRWFVMPQIADQTAADLDRQLHQWLELHIGSPSASAPPVRESRSPSPEGTGALRSVGSPPRARAERGRAARQAR